MLHEKVFSALAVVIASTVDLKMMAERIIKARRSIESMLPIDMLHDPALDILLALYVADDQCIPDDAICARTTVVASVTRRWLKALEGRGFVIHADGMISLSGSGREQMDAMLQRVIKEQVAM